MSNVVFFNELIFYVGFNDDDEVKTTLHQILDVLNENKENEDVKIKILFSVDATKVKRLLDFEDYINDLEIDILVLYDIGLQKLLEEINSSPTSVVVRFYCHGGQGLPIEDEASSYMDVYKTSGKMFDFDRRQLNTLIARPNKYFFFSFCSCQTNYFFTAGTIRPDFIALQRTQCVNEQLTSCNDFPLVSDKIRLIEQAAEKKGFTLLYHKEMNNKILLFDLIMTVNDMEGGLKIKKRKHIKHNNKTKKHRNRMNKMNKMNKMKSRKKTPYVKQVRHRGIKKFLQRRHSKQIYLNSFV